jgi:hypothetical protein
MNLVLNVEWSMKVYMDRNLCNRWIAGCESCFGVRVEKGEFLLDGCVLDVMDADNRDEIICHIKDRDGEDKILTITQDNWAEAFDSWQQLLAKQTAGE